MKKAKRNSKTPNTSTVKKKRAIKRISYKDLYLCTNTWRERPVSKEIILTLARDFWQYCFDHAFKEEKRLPISLARWLIKAGLPRGTFNNWMVKHADFKKIINEAKEMIGIIHLEGLMMKEFSEKTTMFNMHHYSEDWRASEKYQDNRVKNLRPEDSDNRMLQPLMLSADEFRKAIQNDKNKSR